MIATWLPFNYPALHTRAGHIALMLWPPGEPPVSQCAGHLHAVATLLTARLWRSVDD